MLRLKPLWTLAVLFPIAWCGCAEAPKAKLVPAKGRVTFLSKPLTAAEIFFIPDNGEGNQGDMSGSSLDLDGSFTMSTPPKGEGMLPGAYKVTITSQRREPELAKYKNVAT